MRTLLTVAAAYTILSLTTLPFTYANEGAGKTDPFIRKLKTVKVAPVHFNSPGKYLEYKRKLVMEGEDSARAYVKGYKKGLLDDYLPLGGGILTGPMEINSGSSYGNLKLINNTTGGEAAINFRSTDQTLEQGWTIGKGSGDVGSPDFTWYTGGNIKMRLTTDGKLKLSKGALMVTDPTFDNINVRLDASSGLPALRFTRWGGTVVMHNAFVGQFSNAPLGEYSFGIGTGSSDTDQDATTNALTVRLNGNVGIGTTSPSSYGHGGTNRILEIHNPNTAQHSQSHLLFTSILT